MRISNNTAYILLYLVAFVFFAILSLAILDREKDKSYQEGYKTALDSIQNSTK